MSEKRYSTGSAFSGSEIYRTLTQRDSYPSNLDNPQRTRSLCPDTTENENRAARGCTACTQTKKKPAKKEEEPRSGMSPECCLEACETRMREMFDIMARRSTMKSGYSAASRPSGNASPQRVGSKSQHFSATVSTTGPQASPKRVSNTRIAEQEKTVERSASNVGTITDVTGEEEEVKIKKA